MTARTTPQAPGTPTWLDFWCADLDATRAFWTDLLGYDIPPGEANFGGYTVAQKDNRYVFGLGPNMPGSQHDQAATYLATDDIKAAVAKVTEHGGTVLIEPNHIPEHGWMAAATDPAGTMFALWQAEGVVGYGAVDEIGFPCWQDCISSDPAASADFYAKVFGFTMSDEMGPDVKLAKLGDDSHFTVGQVRDGEEGHWCTYLAVEDLDAMISKAEGLGAVVRTPATPLPFGRFAHLRTPGGAPFGFFEGNDQLEA